MNPYAIIAGLLVAIGIYFGGVKTGEHLSDARWQAKEITAQAAAKADHEKLVKDNEQLRSDFANQSRKASDDHAQEIASITETSRLAAAHRVRVSPDFCVPARASSSPSAGAGGAVQDAAPAQFLPDAFAGELRQIVSDADTEVADLRQLVRAAKAAKCFEGYD